MDFCVACGQQAEPETQFCTNCGARLRAPATKSWGAGQQVSGPPAEDAYTQTRIPFGPGGPEYPPAPPAPPGPNGRHDRKQGSSHWPIAIALVLLAAIGGAAVAVILTQSSPSSRVSLSGNKAKVTPSASPSPAPPSSSAPPPSSAPASVSGPPPEAVAAQDLSALLAQSASDRSVIVNAVSDVNSCGPGLASDAQTFQQAASSRQNLLSQLGALPDANALSAQMIQDLDNAWRSSYQADQAFAGWASDENSNGCTANDTADANYQDATGPDNQATADKQAFVALWNPIASQYGLTTYQWNRL
jgi:hypothetical protein